MFTKQEKFTQKILVKNIKIFVMKNKNNFTEIEKNCFRFELKNIRQEKSHFVKVQKLEKLFLSIVEILDKKIRI
jgi:hypothetical protein